MSKPFFKEAIIRLKPYYLKYKTRHLIKAVDARAAISHKSQFIYFRIPKAANSTIIRTLYAYENNHNTDDYVSRTVKKHYYSRPSSLSRSELKKVEQSYFKFTFVRNPLTRLASAYLDKIVNNTRPKKCVANYLDRPLEAPISFREFCDFLKHGEGLYKDVHWYPQNKLITMPIDKLDFIGKIENLDKDMQYVIERLFHVAPENINIFNWVPHKTNAQSKYKDLYDDYTRRLLFELYEEDFKCFGYDMAPLT
jgi:hypothetical protein